MSVAPDETAGGASMSGAVLGIGTATFVAGYGLGAETQRPREAAALLREAIDSGIRYLDTAAVYGEAEAAIGLIADEIQDSEVRVCTKIDAESLKSDGIGAV